MEKNETDSSIISLDAMTMVLFVDVATVMAPSARRRRYHGHGELSKI